MDQEVKMESVAELKEEIFIKVENVCEPELETNESAVLEDPLNVSSYAQGQLSYIKSEIKTEISDVNENCSENVCFSVTEATWEPKENLDCEAFIAAFEKNSPFSKVIQVTNKPDLKEYKLPFNWKKQCKRRKSGKWDVYITHDSIGERFRSNVEINDFLSNHPEIKCDRELTNCKYTFNV